MIVTLKWIKDVLWTKANPEQIAEAFVKLGIEVEHVADRRHCLGPFVVARIESIRQHPLIKKLSICQVSAGEKIQVICGAANAREGLVTVLAPLGSTIPANGMLIEPRTIGKEESFGMLCSASELQLESFFQGQDGIIEMPKEAEIGSKLLRYFELDDVIFHLSITPNRGDCLSVYGLARELAAAGIGKLKPLSETKFELESKSIKMPEGCSMFSCWHIEGIENLQTPEWIRRRLAAAQIALINAPVDVLNYITHTLGQPMHAYDARSLQGRMPKVERKDGYILEALDGNKYKVEQGALSITCGSEVIALAGIIGSEKNKVTNESQSILIESAAFAQEQVARTGQALKINTQARHKFERGVDPNLPLKAASLATRMILDICGGTLKSAWVDYSMENKARKRAQEVKPESIKRILGFKVQKKEAFPLLESLGFKVKDKLTSWEVEVPSWRPDILVEEDIVAELGRTFGYDKLPSKAIAQAKLQLQTKEDIIRTLCANLGYLETISWSFLSWKQLESFKLEGPEAIELENPISQGMSFMRQSMIPNMLEAWRRNQDRGAKGIAIFELGPVFLEKEKLTLALLKAGQISQTSIHTKTQFADIFDIKGDLQHIFSHIEQGAEFKRGSFAPCHPHKCASIEIEGKGVGYMGSLMPESPKEKLPEISFAEVYLSEINFPKAHKKRPWQVSNYQQVQRDFAFLVDSRCELGPVLSAIKQTDPDNIKEVVLFDVFQGKGIPEAKKSFAISCTFQSKKGTMSESEITNLQEKIIALVVQRFGAQPRIRQLDR